MAENDDVPLDDTSHLSTEANREAYRQRMENLRGELRNFRMSHFDNEAFRPILNDEDYKILLEETEFSVDEVYTIKRIYPSYEEIVAMREASRAEREAEKQKEGSVAKYYAKPNSVFIKEFQYDEDTLRQELEAMKAGIAAGEPININLLPRLAQELPLTRSDVEKYIGENIVSKIGIVVLLLGVIILYRYAISFGYLPPWSRVLTGILIGGAFLGTSHYLFLKGKGAPLIPIVCGMFSLYYTLSLSFNDYKLVNQWQTLVSGVGITAAAVYYSVWYNRKSLAIFALLAGYLVPYIASKGDEGNLFYFSYIAAMNVLMLAIAYRRAWKSMFNAAYGATVVMMLGWLIRHEFSHEVALLEMMGFVSLFYVVFFIANIVYDLNPAFEFSKTDQWVNISLHTLYLLTMTIAINRLQDAPNVGLFLFAFALVHFMASSVMSQQTAIDRRHLVFAYLLVFISLTWGAYLLLSGVWLNIFYAAEAVIFLQMAVLLEEKVLANFGGVAMLFTILTLVGVWIAEYGQAPDTFVFNRAMLATCGSIGAMALHFYWASRSAVPAVANLESGKYARFMTAFMLALGFLSGFLELLHNTHNLPGGTDFELLLISLYIMIFAWLLRSSVRIFNIRRMQESTAIIVGLAVVSYLFIGHRSATVLRDSFIGGTLSFFPYGFHYVIVAFSVLLVYLLIRDIIRSAGFNSGKYAIMIWFMCAMFVVHATFELEHTIVLIRAEGIAAVSASLGQIRLAGYTILWTIISFLFMYSGMKLQVKELRVISLVMFSITLVKFFAFDFRYLETIGRIISLIFVGLILTVVSVMYRRLRILFEQGTLVLDRDQRLTQDEALAIARLRMMQEAQKQAEQDGEEQEDN